MVANLFILALGTVLDFFKSKTIVKIDVHLILTFD